MSVTETTYFKSFPSPRQNRMPLHPKIYNVSQPAAGAFVEITVPTSVIWKLVLAKTTYTSDSTSLTRSIYLDIFDEDSLLVTRLGSAANTGITASLTNMHITAAVLKGNAGQIAGANIMAPIALPEPDYFLLQEGWMLRFGCISGTTPMPAADQFGASRFYVDEIPLL